MISSTAINHVDKFGQRLSNSHFEIPHMPSNHYVSLQQRDVEQITKH